MNLNHLKNPKLRYQKGMSLVEVLIGMGLLVFLTAAVIALQVVLAQSEEFSIRTVFTTENANTAIQSIITEVRTARPADTGAFPLEEATDQQIIFYSNVDDDGAVERVRYFLQGTELVKGTINPEGFPVTYPSANEVIKTVAEYIQNDTDPLFTYFNEDWPTDTINNPLPTPADLSQVKLIKVSVRVNADPSQPQSEVYLESSAQIRSLKTNL